MTEVHIHLELVSGKEQELENIFWKDFVPAVSSRDGFKQVRLLKKRDASNRYEIDIVFSNEEQRLAWVASAEHDLVWSRIEKLCVRVDVERFDVCESR
jgi:heme-degrading monooxygenase HmoA